nr:vanomycin resistance protein VanB [Actinomycetales bacterium]
MARRKKHESFDALGGFEEETPEQGGRLAKVALWIVGVVAVLAAAYAGVAFYVQDKVATGTTVLGTDIGGLDSAAAVTKLESSLSERLSAPVPVRVGEQSTDLDPEPAGLAVDYSATVGSITGFTLDPTRLWPHIVGAGPVEPVVDIDTAALSSTLTELAPNVDIEPVDGVIDLSSGAPVITEPVDGVTLDIEASAQAVAEKWPAEEEGIELVTTTVEPDISKADIEEAMATYVQPLLSGPILITVTETTHTIEVEELAQAAMLVPTDAGTLELQIDGEVIAGRIVEESPELGNPGSDARFVFEGGQPVVVPSEPGLGLEPEAVSTAVRDAALTETRSSSVTLTEMQPEFTTEDANSLGIVEMIASFDTPLTADSVRTQNLVVGTAKTNGIVVLPGETFSLLDALRPITRANGFVSSGVVEGGFVSESVGGGLSQLSTTVYNAAYFAGMEIVEHKPHSRWFSRYPEGREATLWDPSVDMKFENSTPYGALIQSFVSDGRVYVRVWSTPHFEVESYTSPRRGITQPTTVYNTNANCTAESGGQSGFTVDVVRTRHLNGAQHDREAWTWTYSPWNRVVCGARPAPQPAAPAPPADSGGEG